MPAGSQAVIWQGALPRRRGILRYRPATVAPLGSRHLRREPMKPTWTQGTQGWIGLALTLMLGACRSPPTRGGRTEATAAGARLALEFPAGAV